MTHGDGALRRVRSIWAPFGDLPRPSVSLLLQAGAVVGITAGASHFIGFGDVMIYMGLVALYIAMGAFGGTLRADLSVAAVYGASLLLFVALPTLAAVRSPIAGAVLVVLAVGICGIIPALGRRYGSVRLGIGLVTVYAFGYETTRNPNHAHLILGSFMALAIILVIRLMAAVPDKDGPLRTSIAEVLMSRRTTRSSRPPSNGYGGLRSRGQAGAHRIVISRRAVGIDNARMRRPSTDAFAYCVLP